MPNDSVSIAIKAKDLFSSVVKTISSSAIKPFNKDIDEMQSQFENTKKKQEELVKSQANLKISLMLAKKELDKATNAWKKLDDEANKAAMEKSTLHMEKLQSKLKDFQDESRRTRTEAGRLQDSLNQMGHGATDGFQSLATGLAASGILKELGTAAAGAADAWATSAYGERTGTMVSSIVGGAASGAAAGSFLGAPGMIAGAAIGGVSGGITGATKNFQASEEVFKGYVQGLYESGKAGIAEGISSGSTIAGSREQTKIAFERRFGSEEEAQKYLSRVKQMAVQTNYDYDEITGYSKKLLNTYDTEKVFDVLRDLSDASAGLNLNTSDVEMFINGLSRMRTTGKATQEYLNYFGERGVDVFDALSRSEKIGVTRENIPDALRRGDINGEDAADAILSYIKEEFGGLSAKLESSYDAVKANLEDAKKNVDEGYGIGYNETRKKGMESELAAYSGDLGVAMSGMNSIIGSSKAYFDNLSSQLNQEAMAALTLGQETTLYGSEQAAVLKEMHEKYQSLTKEYQTADADRQAIIGNELEAMKEKADGMAKAAYDSSGIVKESNRIELDTISALNTLTTTLKGGVEFRVKMDNALSHGSMSNTPFSQASLNGTLPNPNKKDVAGSGGKYAWGLDRVPYDDFPALLHEGERVLTAATAREADRAGNGNGTVSVQIAGNLVVREEADIDRIATLLAEKIKLARMGGVYRNV